MNTEYLKFIESKRHSIGNFGFEPTFIPDIAFDFQRAIIEKAVNKGRMAIFADTGLGKTLIQLSIAQNIIEKTNGKVLILTPLAVAFQFILEAEKIGISDIEYSKDGKHSKNIVICNYERLHYFDSNDFKGVILDESSILKNFEGKIKGIITAFVKKIPYRYLSTATPAPNDYIELGTSSEALGYMGYMDMLTMFFKNNQNSVDSNNRNIGNKYYLKGHAEKNFFQWVNQWALMIKKPSDLGFPDDRYELPELSIKDHVVKNQSTIDVNGQILMFTPIARSFREVKHEQKQTVTQRCEKAVELTKNKTSVYWCNLNEESSLLSKLDNDAHELIGSMSIEKKEDILLSFAKGDIKRIITKAKITGFGLNWQHCNHSVIFPTWSYEQYYQAIRRFWRFGQKNDVVIERVISDGQERVLKAIEEKSEKAKQLQTLLNENLNQKYRENINSGKVQIVKPSFV